MFKLICLLWIYSISWTYIKHTHLFVNVVVHRVLQYDNYANLTNYESL